MRKYLLSGVIRRKALLILVLILSAAAIAYYKLYPPKRPVDVNAITTSYKYPFALIRYTDSGFSPQVIKVKIKDRARIVFTNNAKNDVDIEPTKLTQDTKILAVGIIPHGEKGYFNVVYITKPGEYEYTNKKNTFQKGLIVIEK